jgi:apolipoprotein N-acyltransferase
MRRILLATIAGTLYFLGFAGFDLWPLALVALVPFFWGLDAHAAEQGATGALGFTRRQGFWAGFVLGFVLHVGGYYWMVTTLERFSGFPWVACIALASILWGFQSLMLGVFGALLHLGLSHGLPLMLSAVCAMCTSEWLFPRLFDHFWGASLHAEPLLLQIADLGGPTLLTALLVATNVALYELARAISTKRWPMRSLAAVGAAWAFTLGYGAYRLADTDARALAAPKLGVGLVQADMGLFQKRDDPEEGLKRHLEQSEQLEREHAGKLDLIVWPESAFGWLLPEAMKDVRRAVYNNRLHTPVLFGGLAIRDGGEREQLFNTAFLADEKGKILASYDKTYLLTFSEYIPFGEEYPQIYELSPNSGQFTKGKHMRPLTLGPYRLSALICYEDILPSFVRRMVREAEPHALVNLTNDAWFGDTHAPWEHLALAKLRAVEHHRVLLRATNSGVSAIVDPSGRLVAKSGVFTRENLFAQVPMLQGNSTYAYVGDFPGYLGVLALLVAALWTRLRRRTRAA